MSQLYPPHFLFLVIAFLFLGVSGVQAKSTVLITGSNRGLGLEMARQYAERGYKVIATARNPDQAEALHALAAANPNVVIEKLDVTDHGAIDALAEKYQGEPIDILLNNAGMSPPGETQKFGQIDFEFFDQAMHVNAFASLKMSEAFVENVAASEQKKIVAVSSYMSSISLNRGGSYFYRTSKAALNQIMVTLSYELKGRGIAVGLVNPGSTATDLMRNMTNRPLRDPKVSAADMIRNIDGLTVETAGKLVQYDGSIIPW